MSGKRRKLRNYRRRHAQNHRLRVKHGKTILVRLSNSYGRKRLGRG